MLCYSLIKYWFIINKSTITEQLLIEIWQNSYVYIQEKRTWFCFVLGRRHYDSDRVNLAVTGAFSSQRASHTAIWCFYVVLDKQPSCCWFVTPRRSCDCIDNQRKWWKSTSGTCMNILIFFLHQDRIYQTLNQVPVLSLHMRQATWHCRKNFSQWGCSFQCLHLTGAIVREH